MVPRVFLDFFPSEPLEIEIGGKKEACLAKQNFDQLGGVEIFPPFILFPPEGRDGRWPDLDDTLCCNGKMNA